MTGSFNYVSFFFFIKRAGIYNLTGSRQVSGIHLNSKNQLDLSRLTQGIYLVKVEFSDGTFQMEKVIKK